MQTAPVYHPFHSVANAFGYTFFAPSLKKQAKKACNPNPYPLVSPNPEKEENPMTAETARLADMIRESFTHEWKSASHPFNVDAAETVAVSAVAVVLACQGNDLTQATITHAAVTIQAELESLQHKAELFASSPSFPRI